MRIVRLRIQNFRAIRDAEFVLPENVVLVGDNNSGSDVDLLVIKGGRYDRWRLASAIRGVTEHVHFGSGPLCAPC